MTTSRSSRSALAALYVGLALTVAATIVPYVDRATGQRLADHIRAGYPTYSTDKVDAAVTAYLIILSVIGVLGVVGWLGTAWAVRTGQRWAPAAATAMLVVGVSVGLTALLIKDTSGETGLPALLGWVGMIPSLAGVVAVALLWRRPRTT